MTRAVGILGLGHYVPEKIITNTDMEKIVETSDEWITERTGIKQRHIAAPEEATSDLAYNAAVEALKDAGVAPEELDLVIVGTASSDYIFPSTACLVQARLGAKNAAAFDLAAGCSGFVYSLAVASQMVKSGLYNKILIIGAETLSRIMNWTDRNTCVLFGDGAGAAVVGEVEEGYGVLGIDMGADGNVLHTQLALVDDDSILDHLLQLGDAVLDQTLGVLGLIVLAVLGQVAVAAGFLDLFCQLLAADRLEVFQFLLHRLQASSGHLDLLYHLEISLSIFWGTAECHKT